MEAFAAFPPTRTGAITVPLDHFRYNLPARTFGLRYATYEAFAANESTAPILFYCGNEGAIELFYNATGAIFEHAKALKARAFFIEHRYYGNSLPLGPKASFTPEGLQFLTIEQALADYANVITSLPKRLGCVGTGARRAANRCDVILFGGSYGGMLAAWHRFKYPHLSVGAIASGAPIDFYPNDSVQEVFEAAVVNTFSTYGGQAGGCGECLKTAFAAADKATNSELKAAGVRPCEPMRDDSAERYAFYARGALASIAMVDYPYPTNFIAPLPANPVQHACDSLVNGGTSSTTILAALHKAVLGLVNASHDLKCLNLTAELVGQQTAYRRRPPMMSIGAAAASTGGSNLGVVAWNYQACTELILEPLTSDGFGFYPEAQGQIEETTQLCVERFNVQPRPSWMARSFGIGADWAHASNIVFMENDKDPWHVGTRTVPAVGGVNGTVTRTVAKGGAHHQDLRSSSKLDAPDVVKARAFERARIVEWLRQ